MRGAVAQLAVVFALLTGVLPARAYTSNPKAEKELQQLLKRLRPAFVFFSQGSGVVISADGLVLTNSHVLIKPGTTFRVRLGNGKSYVAELLGRDRFGDLALLKLRDAANLKFLPLGDADSVKAGQLCIALGNPFAIGLVDQTPTATLGVVSGLHQLHGRYTDAIVTDVPINPGNSGGPLINLSGEVIGINGKIEPKLGLRSNTGLAYAIPSNQIKLFLPALKAAKGGDVYHGWLFGLVYDNDDDFDGVGARVTRVLENSDAAAAGFQAGDVITAVNGYDVWSPQRFFGILGTYPGESRIEATVERQGKPIKIAFTLKTFRLGKLFFTLREPQAGDKFLRVDKVEPDSPAWRAGIRDGDEITVIFGRSLAKHNLAMQFLILQNLMVQIRPGTKIILKIRRTNEGSTSEKIIVYNAG